MNTKIAIVDWIKCVLILLILFFISGCANLMLSLDGTLEQSKQGMSEMATIMSLRNQGQFDQAVMVADKYVDAYLKQKNYMSALNYLVSQASDLVALGNYESVINKNDQVEHVYKKALVQYKDDKLKSDWVSAAGSSYMNYLGLYVDASIQLGEYDQLMPVLDKRDKILSEKVGSSELYEINFLFSKVLLLNALDKKSEALAIWDHFSSKYPAPNKTRVLLDDYNNTIVKILPMSDIAWLVDDGNYLLNAGKLLKIYEFPESISQSINSYKTWFGNDYIKSFNTTVCYVKNIYRLTGAFYEAEGLRLTGKHREAIDAYLNYLSKPEVKSQGTYLWKAYDGLGKAYEALHEKEKASNAYLEAINIIENERQFLSKDSYKRNFFLHRDHPYDRAVILLAEHDPEKAFHVAEQGKSRALLDLLEGRPVGRTPEARETNNLISKQGRKLQASSAITRTSTETIPESHLQTTRATMQQAKIELKKTDMELLSMINAQAQTYDEFKPLLTSDTAVIEYYLTPEQGVAFVGVQGNLNALPIHMKEDDIRALVSRFVNGIVAKDAESTLHNAGNRVFDAVLALALNHITSYHKPITRLLIVPHGPLHFLPFSALSYRNQWIIEKYEIVQLPSASVLRFCRNKSAHDYRNILAFGNPVVSKAVPQLPAAQLEVQTIGQLFGQDAKIVMKENAKETLFRSEGFKFDIVHFACHAEFDSKSPSRSALLLSGDTENDGRLEVWEIMQTPLAASFVAMSACNTSRGAISSGDEVVGLSRGMLYAGTPSLLGSLWSIDDKATSVLMASFYKGLLSGKRPTTALRDAQLNMMPQTSDISTYRRPMKTGESDHKFSSSSRYSHPFFWAAFNIIGDWQ
jgi:CHAT domain-containing protein/tetratricopeptide (TPR) repeat protein